MEARFLIKVLMRPDRIQDMINALRLCHMLTHFIGSLSNKVKNFVLTSVNWIYKIFGPGHAMSNLQIKT